jgi:hypothetical protein
VRRVADQRLEHGRQRAVFVGAAQLEAHALGRRGEHLLQLVLELAERGVRRRVKEVRGVRPARVQRLQQRHVEVAHPLARGRHPRQVQRLRLRVLERPHAVVELHQRRDREAQVRDVLGPEPERDHSAQSKSIGARTRRAEPFARWNDT